MRAAHATMPRGTALHTLGWHVLRVPEHQVFADLDGVVTSITERARRLAAARR